MITSAITSTPKINNYIELQPLMAALKTSNDSLPKNSFPRDVEGGIIENKFHAVKDPTLYNAHGIVTPNNPNSLIAYA